MFDLVRTEQFVSFHPSEFNSQLIPSIKDKLNSQFCNKVVPRVGLGIVLFDLLNCSESHVLPGDGSYHIKVEFRYVFFKPSVGEIIIGKVKQCNAEGVYVTLDFFEDIFIPAANLQEPSVYEDDKWIWLFEETPTLKHEMWLCPGDEIKFKVSGDTFVELLPSVAVEEEEEEKAESSESDEEQEDDPYYIIEGTINESGLGVTEWWEGI